MAKRNATTGSPLSFEIEDSLYQQLLAVQKQTGGTPVSVLVEYALKNHDVSKVAPRRGARRQLSVRLPDAMRNELEKHSRAKKVSMALLIREALEALVQAPPAGDALTQAKEAMPPSKKSARKASAKKAAKKATKKAARKGAVKKAVKKAAAKKAAKKAGKKAAKKVTKKAGKKAAKKAGRKAARKAGKKAAKKATKKAGKKAAKKATKKAAKKAGKKAARKKRAAKKA